MDFLDWAVTVIGGTFSGTGSVAGALTVTGGGTLRPGIGGPGVLTTGPADFSPGSSYRVDLNGTSPGAFSQSVWGVRFSTNHCHTISRYVWRLTPSSS